MASKILIVDDEASILESVQGILSDEGFVPVCAGSAEEGLSIIEEERIDVVLLDIWMPGMDGLEALKKIKEDHAGLPVIMISGHGTIETAVQATKMGAFDFIEKPPSYDKIVLAINNALHLSHLEEENRILRQKEKKQPEITGKSLAIKHLKEQIERVAPSDAWVLITGEHGTGKELVAQSIHRLSGRSHKPMIDMNCAAIPEELIESELFGHEKGAFTGANESKRGKFDLADGGMIFLDEIADMSLKTQAKILRILQEQKFERVGGSSTFSVDVRVLAATNKDLEQEIRQGNFREDLYWRLNVVPIHVPPFRERLEDIPEFVAELTEEYARKGIGRKGFTPGALEAMARHTWPGNVRELRNFIERVMIMNPDPVVTEETVAQLLSLPARPLRSSEEPTGLDIASPPVSQDFIHRYKGLAFKEARKAFESDFLAVRLAENQGNISQTAEQIGLERSHLHRKIKSLAIETD